MEFPHMIKSCLPAHSLLPFLHSSSQAYPTTNTRTYCIACMCHSHHLGHLYTQSGARTHDPALKSRVLYGLNQPGAPSTAFASFRRMTEIHEPLMWFLPTKIFIKKRSGGFQGEYTNLGKVTLNPVRALLHQGQGHPQAGWQLPVGRRHVSKVLHRLWKIHKQFRTKTFAELSFPPHGEICWVVLAVDILRCPLAVDLSWGRRAGTHS